MATVEQVYGKAAAMRLRTEKAVMEQFGVRSLLWLRAALWISITHSITLSICMVQRMPGLPSSRAGLDTITGADQEIEFADFLNGASRGVERSCSTYYLVANLSAAFFQSRTSTRSTPSECTKPWK